MLGMNTNRVVGVRADRTASEPGALLYFEHEHGVQVRYSEDEATPWLTPTEFSELVECGDAIRFINPLETRLDDRAVVVAEPKLARLVALHMGAPVPTNDAVSSVWIVPIGSLHAVRNTIAGIAHEVVCDGIARAMSAGTPLDFDLDRIADVGGCLPRGPVR